jgi:hypothetical protein
VLREQLAGTLDEAFVEGLISEHTLSHRLAMVFGPLLVDPQGVVGDLTSRTQRRRRRSPVAALRGSRRRAPSGHDRETLVLALDWTAGDCDLLVGRGAQCDLQLSDDTVSRCHAKLAFRGGGWVIQDLGSTNGTWVNGRRVGRSQVRPGDRVALGTQPLRID